MGNTDFVTQGFSRKGADLWEKFLAFEKECLKREHCRNTRDRHRISANMSTIRRALRRAIREVR